MKKEIQLILIITAIWLWWSGILYGFIVISYGGLHLNHWVAWDRNLFIFGSISIFAIAIFIGDHIMNVEIGPNINKDKNKRP